MRTNPKGAVVVSHYSYAYICFNATATRTLGIDKVEIGRPLERRFRLDLVCPLVYQYTARILSLEPPMNGLKSVGRTIAAGPREKFHVEPRVDWTKDRALGARN